MYDAFYEDYEDGGEESYPDFFVEWDAAVRAGQSPGYYEPEELAEIIEIYFSQDELKKARQAIEHALKLYANDKDLREQIFRALTEYEQWNDVLKLYERLKIFDVWIDGHKLIALLHLGMEEAAFHFFAELKNQYADNHEDLNIAYQAMGEALIETDLFKSAVEVINEAIGIMGENIDFLWLLLNAYTLMEKKEEAVQCADKIQKMNPLDAGTWCRLGITFEELDDMDRAIDAYENARSLQPDSANLMMTLITAYEAHGNYNKALEKASEFLHMQPDNFRAYIILAQIYSDLENWDEALLHINKALDIIPGIYLLYLYKSSILQRLKETDKAKLTLQEGIEKTGDPKGHLAVELTKLNEQNPDTH